MLMSQFSLFDALNGPLQHDDEIIDSFRSELISDSEIQHKLSAFHEDFQLKALEILNGPVNVQDIRSGYAKRVRDGFEAKLHSLMASQFETRVRELRSWIIQNNQYHSDKYKMDPYNDVCVLIVMLELATELEGMLKFEKVEVPSLPEVVARYKQYKKEEVGDVPSNERPIEIPIDSEFDAPTETQLFIKICTFLGIELYDSKVRNYLRLKFKRPLSKNNYLRLIRILQAHSINRET